MSALIVIIPAAHRARGNAIARALDIDDGSRTFDDGVRLAAPTGDLYLAAHVQSPSAHLVDLFEALTPALLHRFVRAEYARRWPHAVVPSTTDCELFLADSIIEYGTPWSELLAAHSLTRINEEL